LNDIERTSGRTLLLVVLALIAFAANSLLCRLALTTTAIDPATFTAVRVLSGAAALWLLTRQRSGSIAHSGSWGSALALFAYAIAFSYAYVQLSAATGALLLFGAVQATMIGYGRYRGERFHGWQGVGFIVAVAGLLGLMLPGATAPPLLGAVLMLSAGIAWGIYSLRGKGSGDAALTTASNFLRAVPAAIIAVIVALPWMNVDLHGLAYAFASGALTSGIGYVIWYAVLPSLSATTAATVQLSVPVIAAFGGVVLLSERPSLRLALASVAILGGVAIVVMRNVRSERVNK